MRLNLTGRHLEITPALRRLVANRVGKLQRMLNDGAVSAQVVLAREKHRHLTEITLHARGEQFLHAVGDTGNWETSLTDATDKLAHQVQKLKGKRQERKRRGVKGAAQAPFEPQSVTQAANQRAPVVSNVAPAPRVRPRMPRTLRASRQAIRVMSVADAARALDGDSDGIVVFLDPESGLINVMYRRLNEELTLVEIEL
jgi:putative sigma-54 modulation protein